MMASDLLVSLFGGSALLKIHAFQNGIFPVFLLDTQHGRLDLLLPFPLPVFSGLAFLKGCIVREQIQLLTARCRGGILLQNNAVGGQI